MHPNDDHPPAPSARPRRKWRVLGVLFLLLILVLGGVYLHLITSAENSWQAAVAEAEQDDPNWRFADMQARRRDWRDEENGALVVRSVKALLPPAWPVWDQYGPAPAVVHDESAAPKPLPAEEEREALRKGLAELDPVTQLDPRLLAVLREELKRAEKALAEARRLALFPHGRFPVQYTNDFFSTLMPEIQDARPAANLLGHDMLLRTQEQDFAGALTSCQAMLHLCRYLDEEPAVVAMLVRVAVRTIALRRLERVLAQGEPEVADLARVQKVLEEEEAVPILLQALRGERAGGDMMAQEMETGRSSAGVLARQMGTAPPGPSPQDYLVKLFPGGLRQQRAGVLKVNNRLIAIAKSPTEQWKPELAKLQQETPSLPMLARLLVPAHIQVTNTATRAAAELRCALAMLAAERYRRAHGRWPADLAALTPDFLAKVPEDPFDGQPLRFLRVADGVVIYSVGLDGADDGGKLSRNPQEKGTDLGFRLWDVPHRRQPPRAAPEKVMKGRLLPRERRFLYAPFEGRVAEIALGPNERDVVQGQNLILLHHMQLETRLQGLQQEIVTLDKRIAALDQPGVRNVKDLAERVRIQTEWEELVLTRKQKKQEFDTLVARTETDPKRLGYIWIKAPFAGQVVNPNHRDKLLDRVVKPTDPLLRVADPRGAWEIELKIPQKQIGMILQAFQKDKRADLDLDFWLSADPSRTYRGKLFLNDIAGEAVPDPDGDGQVVLALAQVEGPGLPEKGRMPRDLFLAGAEVHARVHTSAPEHNGGLRKPDPSP